MSSGVALKQIVAFRLGADLFAADIFSVERVLRYTVPRSVPGLPPWIEGIVDFHGSVVPVVDMRKRFETSGSGSDSTVRLMVLTLEGALVAAIVDEVLDVMQLGSGQLAPPPPMFKGLKADYVAGMAMRGERIVVVLDFARIFSSTERIVLEQLSGGERVD
jgi:purine-binding chemotaxis protein CheW